MNRVLFKQPGLFAQHRRQNEGLMAPHYSAVVHDRINGSRSGPCGSVRSIVDD